jgi:ParB-like chromosome segregation protein Spo0J
LADVLISGNWKRRELTDDDWASAPEPTTESTADVSDGPVEVRIAELRLDFSPRLCADDGYHVRLLAERFEQLPPILVHKETLSVIDGVHRVHAARLLGRTTVPGIYFHGTKAEAYVQSVRANVTHGKPLTIAERERACRRLLALHSDWADRRIASVCGLSAKTVASIRRRSSAAIPRSSKRVGSDGKCRPNDPATLRREIAKVLQADATESLRAVAERVGASQATVLDVRRRLRTGVSPVPSTLEQRVSADAALVAMSDGDDFVKWFEGHAVCERDAFQYTEVIPISRIYVVADEARRRAAVWTQFAETLEKRTRTGHSGGDGAGAADKSTRRKG